MIYMESVGSGESNLVALNPFSEGDRLFSCAFGRVSIAVTVVTTTIGAIQNETN